MRTFDTLENLFELRQARWTCLFIVLAGVSVADLAYLLLDSLYKLSFHPLAAFPGPREAALSKRWLLKVAETGYTEAKLAQMHQKYNSKAIRIAPNELHINDVSLYKSIYSQNSPFMQEPDFYGGFGSAESVFAEHRILFHKERRRLLNPFFSRASIVKMEALLTNKIYELGARIDSQKGPLNIHNAFRCTTVDIIFQYCTGHEYGQLKNSDQDFHGSFILAFDKVSEAFWTFIYRPNLRRILTFIPKGFAKNLSKNARAILTMEATCFNAAWSFRNSPQINGPPVIFSALSHLSLDAMTGEAIDLLIAGSDTTAFTMTIALMEMAKRPDISHELRLSLDQHIPDPEHLPGLLELEKIEYLNACVRESIRFGMAVPGRLPRIVPSSPPFIVDGKRVPPGTIIGMSAHTMHMSKEIWGSDADVFNPDRWIGEDSKNLDNYMVSFSKGVRSCLGQNLAFAEVHFLLAYLMRKYDVKVCENLESKQVHDIFTSVLSDHQLMVDLSPRIANK